MKERACKPNYLQKEGEEVDVDICQPASVCVQKAEQHKLMPGNTGGVDAETTELTRFLRPAVSDLCGQCAYVSKEPLNLCDICLQAPVHLYSAKYIKGVFYTLVETLFLVLTVMNGFLQCSFYLYLSTSILESIFFLLHRRENTQGPVTLWSKRTDVQRSAVCLCAVEQRRSST